MIDTERMQVVVATALYIADKLCDTQAGMHVIVRAFMHAVSDVIRHKVYSAELGAAFPQLHPNALLSAPEAARKAVYTVRASECLQETPSRLSRNMHAEQAALSPPSGIQPCVCAVYSFARLSSTARTV